MDLSVTIISSIAVALLYVFIIKPRQDKKAAETKQKQQDANTTCTDNRHNFKQEDISAKNEQEEEEILSGDSSVPDLATTKTVVWMAHCINLPFLPIDKNMKINMEFMSMLNDFEQTVKTGDKTLTIEIYNKFQDKMKEKLGNGINNPMMLLQMFPFKICALSKDLLDLFKMVIENDRDEDVLSGKRAIRRILKYSIELGSPAKTLDTLTDYFVNNTWFNNMPEQEEWHKMALECMMVTGDGEMGNKLLGLLQKNGGITEEEKEELLNHAREFRNQTNVSWM